MIEYIEVRAKETRQIIGIIDIAKSVIWHTCYYAAGDFEIYAPITDKIVNLLVEGNYITRPDNRFVGVIEKIETTFDNDNGRMIIASGRMITSILDRRVIYRISGHSVSPTLLTGNVESAVRKLITDNAINCSFDSSRNIPILILGNHSGSTKIIVDDNGDPATKQTTYDNLLQWTFDFLHEYGMSQFIGINSSGNLVFVCYEGSDRSVDNTDGNEPVIFSQSFDNLISSDYIYNDAEYKNMCLIGGEGEGTARFCSVLIPEETGIERRELFVDASGSSQTYDDDGTTKTLTDSEYDEQLKNIGSQELTNRRIVQSFDGSINVNNSVYKLGVNFDLGDLITIQDNQIGLYINTRVIEVTEVQDENGYNVNVVYGDNVFEPLITANYIITETGDNIVTETGDYIIAEG